MSKIKKFLKKILPEEFILWTHKMRAVLAAYYYGFPAKKLKIIGVTGTNGKTTTCNLIAKILEEANYKVGLATTINFKIGDKEWTNASKMTTVDPFVLQKLLSEMVGAGCHYGVIETTSHAISQFRNWGIKYNTVVLTNITHEHLDYHKTFENYQKEKLKLFKNIQFAILNKDDKSYQNFQYKIQAKQISYAIEEKADITAKKILYEPSSTLFTAITQRGQIAINSHLPGKFNIYNCLAAIGAGLSQGIDLDAIKKGIERVKSIPGRMEKISPLDYARDKQNYSIIIDYAHTPDAFEKIYETLKESARGKIIHVFGACGDRDKTKRPIMGALAGRWADYIILTDEDPYSENPIDIIEQIAKGVPRGTVKGKEKKEGKNYFKILDRRQAIAKAISLAKNDDVVLITGKGAETCMVIGDNKVPWSDKKVVLEILTNE